MDLILQKSKYITFPFSVITSIFVDYFNWRHFSPQPWHDVSLMAERSQLRALFLVILPSSSFSVVFTLLSFFCISFATFGCNHEGASLVFVNLDCPRFRALILVFCLCIFSQTDVSYNAARMMDKIIVE